jgi:hypothetical protein
VAQGHPARALGLWPPRPVSSNPGVPCLPCQFGSHPVHLLLSPSFLGTGAGVTGGTQLSLGQVSGGLWAGRGTWLAVRSPLFSRPVVLFSVLLRWKEQTQSVWGQKGRFRYYCDRVLSVAVQLSDVTLNFLWRKGLPRAAMLGEPQFPRRGTGSCVDAAGDGAMWNAGSRLC